jgi:large subunit ribosomal protein L1
MSKLATCSLAAARPDAIRFAALPYQTVRNATTKAQPKKKRKARNTFIQYDLKKAEQFPLLDAMQCVRFAGGTRETGWG